MNKALRRTLKISGILLGVLVFLALAASLLVLFDKPLVRSILRRELVRTVGPAARFADLDYSVFPFRVTVDGLEIGSEDAFQKLNATVTRLEARGSFWKLVRGIKPALETFEAGGVPSFEEKARSETPVDIEKALLQVSDMLAWARRIAVSDARLSFALLSGPIEVEHLDLTLTEGPTRDVVIYSIGRGDVSVKDKGGALVFAAGLKSSGRLGLVSPFGVDAEFGLDAPRFDAAGLAGSLGGLTLALTGRLDRPAQELEVSHLKIDVPGLLGLEGKMTGRMGHGIFLEAEARARFDDLAAAAGLLGPLLPPGSGPPRRAAGPSSAERTSSRDRIRARRTTSRPRSRSRASSSIPGSTDAPSTSAPPAASTQQARQAIRGSPPISGSPRGPSPPRGSASRAPTSASSAREHERPRTSPFSRPASPTSSSTRPRAARSPSRRPRSRPRGPSIWPGRRAS